MSVTFKRVKLGRYVQRSQAIDRKPCGGGRWGIVVSTKTGFRYVAEERNFATAKNGAVANRALELIGKELGLFINRKDITHHKKDDLDDMNGKELALEYVRTAQLLLASYAEDEETENNDGE